MSLIGSLEDLGLGDILQIISLSQKSGVLVIRSEHGEGRITFLDGLVRGAVVKGGPSDLRGVLVGGGFVGGADFDACEKQSVDRGQSIADVVAERTDVTAERIGSLQREAVEAAVARMFTWGVGEFSFDVRDEPDPEDPPIFVPSGINAQYLAMECSRLGDEAGRDVPEPEPEAAELSAHEMFGVSPDEPADPKEVAVETITVSTLASADPFGGGAAETDASTPAEEETFVEAAPLDTEAEPELMLAELLPVDGGEPLQAQILEPLEEEAETEEGVAAPPPDRVMPPLVVIDPDLPVLEWVKENVEDAVPQAHIFQRCDLGLARIRQYLVRGTLPMVLVSPDAPGDPLAGIPDATDFVRRLKSQAERMTVLWLAAADDPADGSEPADGRVARPASYQLRNAGAAHQREELAAALCDALVSAHTQALEGANDAPQISPEAMHKLKDVTAALREASSRGEVLPLVIRYAAESFSRVAMFAVLDGAVIGMAQSGLEKAAGPDDAALRQVRLEASDSGWVRSVLESGSSIRATAEEAGDRALALCLGDRVPSESYLAPIESAGQVVALLYADNLPEEQALADTSALEVMLHHAGLALDRAALERALAESDG